MIQSDKAPSVPSTLENIDTAVFRFVDHPQPFDNDYKQGIEKVKILWLGSEAFQIKNNKELRDSVGKLRLPLITIARTSLSKDENFKGAVQSEELADDRIQVRRVISKTRLKTFRMQTTEERLVTSLNLLQQRKLYMKQLVFHDLCMYLVSFSIYPH